MPLTIWTRNFFEELKVQLKDNLFLVVLSVLSFFAVYFVAALIDFSIGKSIWPYIKRGIMFSTPIICIGFGFSKILKIVVFERPPDPTKKIVKALSEPVLDFRRYARVVPLLLIATLAFFAFVQFKVMIPELVPFYGDQMFHNMDRFIHFGRLPHEWLAPLLNSEWFIYKIDFAYKLWYFPMFLIWTWAAWGASDDGWRRQYVLSFILCWIVGGVILATLLSSVGPCYYAALVDPVSPYAEQMATLKSYHKNVPLMAVTTQEALLMGYQNPETYPIRAGISAMPSLHNCLSMLFVIAGYKIHKILGHIMLLFVLVIFVGSVLLGWHYAADAYLGFAVAFGCWKLSGWILKRQDSFMARVETKEQPEAIPA